MKKTSNYFILLPVFLLILMLIACSDDDYNNPPTTTTVVDVAVANGFNSLAAALIRADLITTLQGPGRVCANIKRSDTRCKCCFITSILNSENRG